MKKLTKLAQVVAVSCAAVVAAAALNAAQAVTFRLGYETPRTDSQHIAAEEFKRIVEEKTGGEIEIRLFPDSTLGGAQALINGVRNGTIDMIITGSNNASGLSTELNVIDIPYLFTSREQAFKILDGEIGQYLLDGLAGVNIKGLAFWDNGFREMTNNRHPITKPEDVAGLKMRVPGNPMSVKLFETLGANPVPMTVGELYTALETRTVDAQDHPIGVTYSSKFFEVQKYLSFTNHQYTALLMAMNKDKFDGLTPEQQEIIVQAARDGANYQRKVNLDKLNEQVDEMKSYGMEVVYEVDPIPFREATFEAVSQFYIDQNGDELLKRIEAALQE